MNIPYVTTGTKWTFYVNGKPTVITEDDIRYDEIIAATMAGDNDKLEELLKTSTKDIISNQIITEITNFGDLKFTNMTYENGDITTEILYKGRILPTILGDKLISLWKDGCTDFAHYFAFIDNLLANPSDRAREELYSFLEAANLPISQNGTFIAYKGLRDDMTSVHGNTNTTVLSGERLDDGRIKNNVGDIIQVRVEDVDPNRNNYCSCGLHVGSYSYASGFASTVISVEVNPADVVSVPSDCGCQKCRVSKYKVLAKVSEKHTTPDVVVNADNTVVETNNTQKRDIKSKQVDNSRVDALLKNPSKTREAIDRNISSHTIEDNKGFTRVGTTIGQLCSSVGRKLSISRTEMFNVLLKLGYTINETDDGRLGNYFVLL